MPPNHHPAFTPGQSVWDVDGEYPVRILFPRSRLFQTDVWIVCLQCFEALLSLLPLFELHFGYAFPYLRLSVEGYRNNPPHLVNIACALAARYSPIYSHRNDIEGSSNSQDGAARCWASKAKDQVLQVLAVASLETVKTLLLIAWYEFGQDRDTVKSDIFWCRPRLTLDQGLWM